MEVWRVGRWKAGQEGEFESNARYVFLLSSSVLGDGRLNLLRFVVVFDSATPVTTLW